MTFRRSASTFRSASLRRHTSRDRRPVSSMRATRARSRLPMMLLVLQAAMTARACSKLNVRWILRLGRGMGRLAGGEARGGPAQFVGVACDGGLALVDGEPVDPVVDVGEHGFLRAVHAAPSAFCEAGSGLVPLPAARWGDRTG